MNRSKTRRMVRNITRMAMLAAVALALGWVERFIPVPMPGIKLGLANTVLLYALYLLDVRSAVLLMILKVGLSGLLYAGVFAMIYSFCGGALSLLMMVLVKKLSRDSVSIIGVSAVGAVFHNVGQLIVAIALVGWRAVAVYGPVLIIAGLVMGVVTGIVGRYATRALAAAGTQPASGAKPEAEQESRPQKDVDPREEPK